jgi:hypothetical protein
MKSLLILSPLLLVACVSNQGGPSSVKVASPAAASDRAALIDRVKTLAGTWESTGPDGTAVASVFTVGSGGSAVREVMMPGTPQEMTNMYTMDGPTMVMTHYCAMGNQPHMRAHAGSDPKVIRLESDGVSGLKSAEEEYMGAVTLTFVDADHLKADWQQFQGGKTAGEPMTFTMTRKK